MAFGRLLHHHTARSQTCRMRTVQCYRPGGGEAIHWQARRPAQQSGLQARAWARAEGSSYIPSSLHLHSLDAAILPLPPIFANLRSTWIRQTLRVCNTVRSNCVCIFCRLRFPQPGRGTQKHSLRGQCRRWPPTQSSDRAGGVSQPPGSPRRYVRWLWR